MTNFLHYPQTFKWTKCLTSNMFSEAPRGQIKKVMIFALWVGMDWYVVRKCSVKRVFCKTLCKIQRKTTVSESLFLQNCRPTIAEKRLPHMCFPIKFAKFLRTSFLKNISGRLILDMKFFKQFFTHVPLTFGTIRERFIFAIISLFLLLVSGFHKPWSQGMLINLVTWQNSDYIDKVFMEAFKH